GQLESHQGRRRDVPGRQQPDAMILALGLWTAMSCLPLEGDRILARDLAAATPAFALWPPETELGYAPAPGLRRVLRAAELRRLASRQGLDGGAMADVCVERPT